MTRRELLKLMLLGATFPEELIDRALWRPRAQIVVPGPLFSEYKLKMYVRDMIDDRLMATYTTHLPLMKYLIGDPPYESTVTVRTGAGWKKSWGEMLMTDPPAWALPSQPMNDPIWNGDGS